MPAANQAGLGCELRMRSTGLSQSAGGAGTSTSSIWKSPFGASGTPAPFVLCSVSERAVRRHGSRDKSARSRNMTRDRNKKTLDAAAEMLGSEVLAIQADVTVARPDRARASTGDILGPCHDDRGRCRRTNRRAAPGDPAPRLPLLRRQSSRGLGRRVRRAAPRAARARGRPSRARHAPTAPPRAWAGSAPWPSRPSSTGAPCSRSTMRSAPTTCASSRRASPGPCRRRRFRTSASRRSTGSGWPCSTRAAA